MKKRHLDAKGLGEYTYDYDNDILLFRIKDRNYLKSAEFDNFTVDIDDQGFITGIRVFDASKVFRLDKVALKQLQDFDFHAEIDDGMIRVELKFITLHRNKEIRQGENFTVPFRSQTDDSVVSCTA